MNHDTARPQLVIERDIPRSSLPDGVPELLVFVGNPTQYHSPIFRSLSRALKGRMEVMYGDDIGARPFYNPEVDAMIEWDVPVLDGFPYKIFKNLASSDRKGFWSRNNPDMIWHVIRSPAKYVLLHGYDTLSAFYVYVAGVISGKKIIWRGETVAKPGGGINRTERIKRMILPFYFRFCHKVLFSCLNNRDYLASFLRGQEHKFASFPCAVDNDFFKINKITDNKERMVMRERYGIPSDHMVVATCSRLTKRKRTHLILEAIGQMDSRRVTLLIIGDGPERDELKAQAKELGVSLALAGFVGQFDVAKLLSIADVFALLSIYDASPKALNEAMNFSIPIIASTGVGTARDLVRSEVNGYLFETGEDHLLLEWLNDWLENPQKRESMGKKNAEIIKDYTIDIDVKNLLKVMQRA